MLRRPPFPSGWHSIPLHPSNLTLANTLPVGQSFVWHRAFIDSQEEFSRGIDNPPRVICLRQTPSLLYWTALHPDDTGAQADKKHGLTQRWLDDYFQLSRYPDLSTLYHNWRERDPELFGRTELDSRAIGVRVLRQDPWECLVAFITSTNNNIPRISSLMHKLSYTYSPPILSLDDITYHSFPPPHLLPIDLESTLRTLGFGYRAGFIDSTLSSLRTLFGSSPGAIEEGLSSWRTVPVDKAREDLISFKGVGRKVADCVMLMCLDRPSIIPIDTHVAAIAARHPSFPSRLRNKPMSKEVYDQVQAFLEEKWGPLGGWTQAVMFAADLPPAKPRAQTTPSPSPSKRKQEVEHREALKRTRSATRLSVSKSLPSVKFMAEAVEAKLEIKE